MRLLTCGDRATLLDCADGDEARRWFRALRPVADVTLGAKTVLVREAFTAAQELVDRTTPTASSGPAHARTVTMRVTYDGDDLQEVSRLTGLDEPGIVAAHTGTPWTVAFAGFAPGFAYLTGGDARLVVPRRESPRPAVPAGSVALAGPYSGVYPRSSPGGWQLIGHTDVAVWDLGRPEPALLRLGDIVHFEVAP
jgi:KipI family sensor histidine kinase inhibitor